MDQPPLWIVTLAPAIDARAAAHALERAGLDVETVLDALGVITGRAAPALLPALRALPGVADISPDMPLAAN